MCVFRFVMPGTLTIHPMFELLLLRSFTIIIQQEIERESIILVFLATFNRLDMNTEHTPYFSEIPAQMLELKSPTFLRTIVARSPMPLELVQPLTARLVRDARQIVAVNADNDNGRWGWSYCRRLCRIF